MSDFAEIIYFKFMENVKESIKCKRRKIKMENLEIELVRILDEKEQVILKSLLDAQCSYYEEFEVELIDYVLNYIKNSFMLVRNNLD